MARWWNVGKDGTVFVNCLKPAKTLLLQAKGHPVKATIAVVGAAALLLGGTAYYVYKKIKPGSSK